MGLGPAFPLGRSGTVPRARDAFRAHENVLIFFFNNKKKENMSLDYIHVYTMQL